MTKVMEIASTDELQLKTASGSYACGNTNVPAECQFEQLAASSPAMTEIAVASATTVTVTGTGFPTSGYESIVVFQGVESTSAVITDATTITATFANGVPLADTAAAASLRFVPTGGRRLFLSDATMQLVAAVASTVTVTNTLAVTGSTQDLTCSYQGGCTYSVTADGLTSSLLAAGSTNEIDVCGNPCVVDAAASDSTQTTCTVPLLSTSYSAKNYEIVTEGIIHAGTWTGTASDVELAKLIDASNLSDMIDGTSTNCYAQI